MSASRRNKIALYVRTSTAHQTSRIDFSDFSGNTVYEPFAGSGTTLIAAEQLGRRCLAIEIEPRDVQVVIDRWEAFTGQKVIKVGVANACIAVFGVVVGT